jgi:hypothetical protein
MITPPILIYPVPGKRFILDTDASDKAVGAVLSQQIDDNIHFEGFSFKCASLSRINMCSSINKLSSTEEPGTMMSSI